MSAPTDFEGAQCRKCGLPFAVPEGQRPFATCLPCWKEARDYDLTKADAQLRATMKYLASTLHTLGVAVARGRAATPPADVPLEDLLQLVHPDRHPDGLRERANRATRWVIEQRKARRG